MLLNDKAMALSSVLFPGSIMRKFIFTVKNIVFSGVQLMMLEIQKNVVVFHRRCKSDQLRLMKYHVVI